MVVVPKTRCRIRTVFVAASIVLAAAACGSGAVPAPPSAGQTPGSAAAASDGQLVEKLTSEVGVAGAMVHLEALQKIADEHGGNRAAGTAGFDASVDYTAGVLRAAASRSAHRATRRRATTTSRRAPAATSSRRRTPETPTTS